MRIGISTVGGVVRIHASAIRIIGAVAAEEPDIIYERVFTRVPEKPDRPGVEAAGKNAETADDIGSSRRREQQRPGTLRALERRCAVRQVELCRAGVQSDEHSIRAESDGVVQQVAPAG